MSFQVVGILNVTPDSFYDGGKFESKKSVLDQAKKLVDEGANMLDVGGESTRPGAKPVSLEEEKQRVLPVIEQLVHAVDVPISIDTYKASIAKEALQLGASFVNDISGLTLDPKMPQVISDAKAKVVIGHIQGTPQNMQTHPTYENVVQEIYDFFKIQIQLCQKYDIPKERIILDPGIGFGKTVEHTIEIFKNLKSFQSLGCAIMVGASRKSFIGKILPDKGPQDRLGGSIAACVMSYLQGVTYFRVHDVWETVQALKLCENIK